ncbi:DNA mismatch repair protein mutH [Legionella beliardensis]|uniref:DNA mismatch repair protein MutH n=1 Tax=Legionella beliardensis TaxID=91822 RepID=A0A378I2G0_9GAMM|nr:DNA mismatch repair endonuclease MutH [Legionella beliardensis]STX28920.1 DNA mismatch repair protein mutH [Legionella beliardensis]
MNARLPKSPPNNEDELLFRCLQIEGISFAQLANFIQASIPKDQVKRKGWAGQAIELILGATAGTKAVPDFNHLNIELKTIPFNNRGKPAESTFITSIPLLHVHRQEWYASECYQKLKRILWIPVEGAREIPFAQRRIGQAYLWSPTPEQEEILQQDWLELTTMIGTGRLEEIDATMGHYLQVRPKAANARSLCYGLDNEGNKILTLPRGFYLRRSFTEIIFSIK